MKAVVFVAIAAMCAVSAMAADFCVYKVGDDTYNLSSLGHTPGDRETVFHMLRDGGVVTANLCGKTSLICPNTSSVCLRTSKFSYASRGDDGTMKLEPFKDGNEYGLIASFETKEACGKSHYSTKVHLVCAHVKENQVVSATGDDSSCEIELVVKTRAVCLDNSSSFSSSSSKPTSSTPSSSAATTLFPSFALVLLALAAYIFQH